MQQSIAQAEQWLRTPYEEHAQGLTLYRNLRKHLNTPIDTNSRRYITALMQRVDDRMRFIRTTAYKSYRPTIRRDGQTINLPLVAFIPTRTVDDETGIVTLSSPYIDLTSIQGDEQRALTLKAEADRLMNETHEDVEQTPVSSAPTLPDDSISVSSPKRRRRKKKSAPRE